MNTDEHLLGKKIDALEGYFQDRDLPEYRWPAYERPLKSMGRSIAESKLGHHLPDTWSFAPESGEIGDAKPSTLLIIKPDGSSAKLAEILMDRRSQAKADQDQAEKRERVIAEIADNLKGGS